MSPRGQGLPGGSTCDRSVPGAKPPPADGAADPDATADPTPADPCTTNPASTERDVIAVPAPVDPYATADPVPVDPYATADHIPSTVPPWACAAGPVIADYELLAELGHGGMGVVYKARQRSLGRLVALKMIRHGSRARPDQFTRFRIEAEAVARLHHANIVQIYDVGEAAGLPFFSLELLEGGSLADRIAGTPQPEEASATLMVALARAVHAAHQAGIVHRDLKPGNVLFDRDGTPKITDFGLAKRLEQEEGQTQTGQVVGTPSYMAPEQARGRAHEVGPPADVYALGTILYELLTGRPPFMGASREETVRQVIDEDPVPPSRLRPKVSRDLETICLKCLAKEPHKRYAGAAELADDLVRHLRRRPILARRTPLWERGLKWARRHPTAATLLALAATAALGLVGTWAWYTDRIRTREGLEARRVASRRIKAVDRLFRGQDALSRADFAAGKDDVAKLLGEIEREPQLADLRARAADLLDQLNRGMTRAQAAEADRARCRADRDRYGRLLEDSFLAHYYETQFTGLDPLANVQATRAAARTALSAFAIEGPDLSWTLPPLPTALTPRERDDVAEGCYELLLILAEAECQSLPGEDDRRQAERGLRMLDGASRLRPSSSRAFLLRRAACLARAGDFVQAEQERRRAAVLEPAGPFDLFLIGQERYRRGDRQAALRAFEAVLQEQPDHFWAQCLLAICQMNANPSRPDAARAGLTACLQRRPDVPWLYLLRGFASGQMALLNLKQAEALPGRAGLLRQEAATRFEEAEDDYRRASERLAAASGDELRYILHVNRGVLRLQCKRWDDATSDLQEAIRLDPEKFFPYDALAQVYEQQDRLDDALAALSEAVARQPDRAELYRKRARLHARRREIPPALRDLEDSIRLEVPGSPAVAADQTQRGRLLHGTGRLEEALASYDAALKVVPADAETHRLRVDVLLKLKRYDEVIGSCDGYLAKGPPSADLHALRGLARVARNDLPGAIEDYTQALALRPGAPRVLIDRGWAYLLSDAPNLALRDFEESIRLDPTLGDAYGGRGNAQAHLGRHREAAADALQALHRGEPSARTYYNAARTLTQAGAAALTETDRRGLTAVEDAGGYLDRAQELLGRAIEALPAAERAAFWRDVVRTDPALVALRRRPRFTALAQRYAEPTR